MYSCVFIEVEDDLTIAPIPIRPQRDQQISQENFVIEGIAVITFGGVLAASIPNLFGVVKTIQRSSNHRAAIPFYLHSQSVRQGGLPSCIDPIDRYS